MEVELRRTKEENEEIEVIQYLEMGMGIRSVEKWSIEGILCGRRRKGFRDYPILCPMHSDRGKGCKCNLEFRFAFFL